MPESSLPIPSARVLLGIVAIFALMTAMAVFESHRIVGPIYRFEKTLKALIAGEVPQRITLRRSDNFTHLVPVINELAARYEPAARAERLVRETLAPRLDELEALCRQDNVPEQVRRRVEELRTCARQALRDLV
jgi:methyl-accepting chemotaxis protein